MLGHVHTGNIKWLETNLIHFVLALYVHKVDSSSDEDDCKSYKAVEIGWHVYMALDLLQVAVSIP